ncbi:MAG: phosphopentomutase [Deltaproteobacteria bacterium]|nr:phosphopentomutase [Deltaproteobacteria bacterium]
MQTQRIILIVLDGCGCGATQDAGKYHDEGSNTLGHCAHAVGGLHLPALADAGLGNLTAIEGVAPVAHAHGAFGKLAEASCGKDTQTGHWEMAGLRIDDAFTTFSTGFPPEIIDAFRKATGRGVLGNKAASGTVILDELAPKHLETGDFIVYTSADSVFQIAAHEDKVPLEELYAAGHAARKILDPYRVGRVILRPFVGEAGKWKRTYNRRDLAMPPPAPTVLDHLKGAGHEVVAVGKIDDIFAGRGVTRAIHTEGNADGLEHTLRLLSEVDRGLIFVNLVDFDMLYGHRRDPAGYARALTEFDTWLPRLRGALGPGDLAILSSDHGNDPCAPGTDHTREHVPLLAFGPSRAEGADLGVRKTFADIGATVADAFGVTAPPHGESFFPRIAP